MVSPPLALPSRTNANRVAGLGSFSTLPTTISKVRCLNSRPPGPSRDGLATPPVGWGSVSAFEGLSLVARHRPAFGVVVGSRGGAATPLSSIDVTIRLRGWRRFNDLGSTCSQLPPDSGSSAGARKARASPRMASSCAAADALTARPRRVFPLRFHAMSIGTRLVAPRLPLLPFYFFRGARGRSLLADLLVSRARRRSARAAREYRPCFQRAPRLRSSPSAVRGPVLRPPCIRQRAEPRTAGARHGWPPRVRAFAPQRGARDGSPQALPFRRLFLPFQKLTCSAASPPVPPMEAAAKQARRSCQ